MANANDSTSDLQKLVRLCLVFSQSPAHLRLLDAILRVDPDQVRERLEDVSPHKAMDGYIYPMILQLVIDHGHPVILEAFVSSGNTAAAMIRSPPVTSVGSGPRTVDVEDMCAWRLSTNRCIELVDHGMLDLKSDTFERLLVLSDSAGFDRLLNVVFEHHSQPALIAGADAPLVDTPWLCAIRQASVVGPWMAAWRLQPWCVDALPLMHPLIQDQAREMTRRWTSCMDGMLKHHYPDQLPASRFEAMVSHPFRIRVDLGLSDFDRVHLLAGIIEHAMEQSGATPSNLPENTLSTLRLVDKYDWMHALMLCGFKQNHFPLDPLSELLRDAGKTLEENGNRSRLTDTFMHLYSRIVSDLTNEGSDRLASIPAPFSLAAELNMYAPAARSINATISELDNKLAVSLGGALIMHAGTVQSRTPSSPTRRM